jgi:hypothetical protein
MLETFLLFLCLLILLFFNSLAILGFHYASQPGMILQFMQRIRVSEFWQKPLHDCPTCMSSLHSTYFFIPFAIIVNPKLLFIYPLYILALAGLSTILARLSELMVQEIKEIKEDDHGQ